MAATGTYSGVSTGGVRAGGIDPEELQRRRNNPTFYNDRNTELFTTRRDVKARIAALSEKKRLTANQRIELARVIQRLDDITSEIVQLNHGLVKSYVKKFTSTSRDDSDDFEAAGMVGLMRAIDTYDLAKGRFGQWAFKPIQREVLRAVRDADHPNMNPGDFEKRPDILSARRRLQAGDEDYRPPYEDVAKLANTTPEQVARVLDAPRLESLSTPVGDDGETQLGDLIPDSELDVEERVLGQLNISALTDHGLTALDPRELFVIFRRFGLDAEPEQCLSSIGEMLGLSREAVRQIEAKALAKLNHPSILRKLVRHGRR